MSIFKLTNIKKLKEKDDIEGLVRALHKKNINISWQAAEVLLLYPHLTIYEGMYSWLHQFLKTRQNSFHLIEDDRVITLFENFIRIEEDEVYTWNKIEEYYRLRVTSISILEKYGWVPNDVEDLWALARSIGLKSYVQCDYALTLLKQQKKDIKKKLIEYIEKRIEGSERVRQVTKNTLFRSYLCNLVGKIGYKDYANKLALSIVDPHNKRLVKDALKKLKWDPPSSYSSALDHIAKGRYDLAVNEGSWGVNLLSTQIKIFKLYKSVYDRQNEYWDVLESITQKLAKVRNYDVIPLLEEIYNDNLNTLVASAAEALGDVGCFKSFSNKIIPILLKGSKNYDFDSWDNEAITKILQKRIKDVSDDILDELTNLDNRQVARYFSDNNWDEIDNSLIRELAEKEMKRRNK